MGKSILFCQCGGGIIHSERLKQIEEYLRQTNADIIKLSDLCGLAALDKGALNNILRAGSDYLIIGCYSRTMKLLLEQIQIDFTQIPVKYVNYTELTNEQIFQEITLFSKDNSQEHSFQEVKSSSEWPSWYPIVDYSRCSACGQCADFCLFRVYTKNENKVEVTNPQGCKNNCPACARICPQTAIIFPKYKHGGSIGGSEIIDEIAEQKRQALDIKEVLGSDIYGALEQRKIKRQSIIRNEAIAKANEERDKALKENEKK